jgi:hypothetical protein
VYNSGTQSRILHIPDASDHRVYGSASGKAVVITPSGHVDFQADCSNSYVNWFVTYNATSSLVAGPPPGYTGAVAPAFIEDDETDPNKLQLRGGNWLPSSTPNARGNGLHYLNKMVGGDGAMFGYGYGFELWDTTDTTYRSYVHVLVALDGGPLVEVQPQPTQRLNNPDGTSNSWAWYVYPSDGKQHTFEVYLRQNEGDPDGYVGYDGTKWRENPY